MYVLGKDDDIVGGKFVVSIYHLEPESSKIVCGQIFVSTLASCCDMMFMLFPVSGRLLLLLFISLNPNFKFGITSVTLFLFLFLS